MSNHSPIPSPPSELVEEWQRTAPNLINKREHYYYITLCAAQWGADQELEACCQWLSFYSAASDARDLRTARRPKPPSLRKQAYDALDTYIYGEPDPKDKERTYNTIRRALEQL